MMPVHLKPTATFFTMPMGVLALGLNGEHLQLLLDWQSFLPDVLMLYGALALLLVSLYYLAHWLHPQKCLPLKSEWQHPLLLSFFPAATLSYLLLIVALQVGIGHSNLLVWSYYAVVGIHTALVFKVISHWLFVQIVPIEYLKPTWFIMLSANFVVVITGVGVLPSTHNEFLWFYFSISILLWLVFAFMLMYRLIFDQPLKIAMRPTLFIFMAPPSLGLIASILIYEDQGMSLPPILVWGFYGFALMFFVYWLFAAKHFVQAGLSRTSWSYVYPISAFGVANQFMYAIFNLDAFLYFAGTLFLVNLGFVLLLTAWMLKQWILAAKVTPE